MPVNLHRWSMGSLLFLASWAVLMGPVTYAKHLLSTPRLPFTAAYFGSIALTLYFAVGVSLHAFPCFAAVAAYPLGARRLFARACRVALCYLMLIALRNNHSSTVPSSPFYPPSPKLPPCSGIWSATSPWVGQAYASRQDSGPTAWRRG